MCQPQGLTISEDPYITYNVRNLLVLLCRNTHLSIQGYGQAVSALWPCINLNVLQTGKLQSNVLQSDLMTVDIETSVTNTE